MKPLPNDGWGSWVLGDLCDLVRLASELVGRSADVHTVSVTQPDREHLPEVSLTVPTRQGVFRLRSELLGSGFPVTFLDRASDTGWRAETRGLVLRVEVEEIGGRR